MLASTLISPLGSLGTIFKYPCSVSLASLPDPRQDNANKLSNPAANTSAPAELSTLDATTKTESSWGEHRELSPNETLSSGHNTSVEQEWAWQEGTHGVDAVNKVRVYLRICVN